MALLNPMYGFMVPFLFIFTIPLAILAGITTTLAFSVLILRVIIVYLDLAWALVPQYVFGRTPGQLRYVSKSPSASGSTSPADTSLHRRRRRPSSASVASAGTITPMSEAGLGLIPSVGIERDFEGVGGWRLGDDDLWTQINSRLELPDNRPYGRNHQRSPSGGATTPGAEGGYLMMKSRNKSRNTSPEAKASAVSPNSSRTRTPTVVPAAFTSLGGDEGYFPPTSPPRNPRRITASVW
jgi:hypothetical protein